MMDDGCVLDVKIPPWKYEEIEKKVVNLYVQQGIHCLPIDPFEIVKNRGYILVPFSKFGKESIPECANENNDAFSFYDPLRKTYFIG